MADSFTRRRFLAACSSTFALSLIPGRSVLAHSISAAHPTPRPGITGAKVLTKEQLPNHPKLIPLFDSVREIPEIIDGIHCSCGCTDPPDFYSLLSCFEGRGMARDCYMCQREARLVVRLHKEGKSLNEIRAAVDARFG